MKTNTNFIKLLNIVFFISVIILSNIIARVSIADSSTPSPIKKITTVVVNKVTSLKPPIGFKKSVNASSIKSLEVCDSSFSIPPYINSMNFISRYEGSDSSRSQINEEANQAYIEQVKTITKFESKVVRSIDSYIETGDINELNCVIGLLYSWAENQALLTHDRNVTGAAVRKWALSSIASAYMRLKFSISNPLIQHKDKVEAIEDWYLKLANRVRLEDAELNYYSRVNNHAAWAANAVMVVAVILNNRDLYNSSVSIFKSITRTIDNKGMLPSELVRDSKALQYHAFTMLPLFSMAAIMKENSYYFSRNEIISIKSLSAIVFDDLYLNKQSIANVTGKEQNINNISINTKSSWLPPYCYIQACNKAMLQRVNDVSSIKTTRLGGPVNSFYK